MENIKKMINSILENKGETEITSINRNDNLRNDLGLDSFDLAELTVRIEAKYDVDVFENGIVNTVGEILDLIGKNERDVL